LLVKKRREFACFYRFEGFLELARALQIESDPKGFIQG
jgi:hypothetical protein